MEVLGNVLKIFFDPVMWIAAAIIASVAGFIEVRRIKKQGNDTDNDNADHLE